MIFLFVLFFEDFFPLKMIHTYYLCFFSVSGQLNLACQGQGCCLFDATCSCLFTVFTTQLHTTDGRAQKIQTKFCCSNHTKINFERSSEKKIGLWEKLRVSLQSLMREGAKLTGETQYLNCVAKIFFLFLETIQFYRLRVEREIYILRGKNQKIMVLR